MSRTAIPGGCTVANAGSAAVDTNGYGTVTLLIAVTNATNSITINEGDTSGAVSSAVAAADLIDPTTGEPADLSANQSNGALKLVSYIGYRRYIQATATGATVYAILGEARMTTPFE